MNSFSTFFCFICGHFTNILCKVLFTFYRDFINISHYPLLTRPILGAFTCTEKTLTFCSDFKQSNTYILQTFHVLYLKILCSSFGIHFTDISCTFFRSLFTEITWRFYVYGFREIFSPVIFTEKVKRFYRHLLFLA